MNIKGGATFPHYSLMSHYDPNVNANLTKELQISHAQINALQGQVVNTHHNYMGMAASAGKFQNDAERLHALVLVRDQQIAARDQHIAFLNQQLAFLRQQVTALHGENMDVRAGAMPNYTQKRT